MGGIPENIAAMTPKEQNVAIWAAFADDEYLPQEPKLKQYLVKYSLVQPIDTSLLHDVSALIDAFSK